MGFIRYFGMVADRDRGHGIANARVEAWDVEGVLSDAVAITTTGPDGLFSFALSRRDVDRLFRGRKPVIKFKVVTGTFVVADTQSSHTWHLRDHARGRIDVNLTLLIGSSPTPPRLVVRGTVADAETGVSPGITVKAFDRNVTSQGITETLLGTDTSDARGHYHIAFDNRVLGRAGKEAADLVVRAYVGGMVRAEQTACAALPVTSVPLVLNGDTFHSRGEHAWLIEKLDGLRGEVSWQLLSESQAELLSCSGRVDRLAVDALIAAAQLAIDVPAVPQEAFYGLVRHGLPASRVQLLSHRPAHLRRTLGKAISAGTVSHALSGQLGDIEQALLAATVLVSFEPRPGGVGFGTLVSRTPNLSAALQQSFVQKVLEHTGDVGSFWALIENDQALSSYAAALYFTVEIAPLVANHTPMIDELHVRRTSGQLTRPDDVATLLDSDWAQLVNTTDVPAGTPGTTPAQKRANYAAWISRTVEARFRTARIADRIRRAEPTADVTTFFADNPGFRFEKTRVARYLAETPNALDNVAEANRPAAIARLKKLERQLRVTRTYSQMTALEDAGLVSAHAIHRKGKKAFVTDLGLALGGEMAATEVFLKASWAVAAGTALLGKFASTLHVGVTVLPDGRTLPDPLPNAVADWATLFGAVDTCACEQCQSVLGSSAYLVDLLQFLERQPAPGGTGRDRLFDKRPDVQHLELSCATSDTPLPYVDLVNEVMEIALLAGETPSTPWPTVPGKTIGTPEELLAGPDVVYPEWHVAASNFLANALYPFEVPFHLWNEHARVHLQHLGVPRWELIEALGLGEPSSAAVVAERLAVSPLQRAIIAGQPLPGVTLGNLWGYPSNSLSFPTALSNARTFVRKAGLSHEELLELIGTGLYAFLAIPENAGCDLATINWGVPGTAALTQVHRFLRLQRALGWSITDLGKMVTAFGPIDDPFVQSTAAIETLRSKLSVDVPTVLSLFADIDRNGAHAPSLFERLFLQRTVADPEDKAFRDVFEHPNGAPVPAQPITDNKGAILVAVGASPGDLDLVIDNDAASARLALSSALTGAATPDDLNLANLSRIHRFFALARALRLPVGDLRVLDALSTTPILAGDLQGSASPASTLDFVQVAARVRQSGLSIAEIHYLLRHVAEPGAAFVPPEDQLDQLLAELASAVERAAQETEKASDPDGQQTETLLSGLLSDPALVTDLMAILNGTSALPRPTRLLLVETHLAAFVEDIAAAKSKLVGLVDDDPNYLPTAAERMTYLAQRLLRHAIAAASVEQALGTAFALLPDVVHRLVATPVLASATVSGKGALFDFVPGPNPLEPAGSEAVRRAHLLRLHKASLLVRRLRLSSVEVLALFSASGAAPAGGLPWIDLDALPVETPESDADLGTARPMFAELLRLLDLTALRDRWPAGAGELFSIFTLGLSAPIEEIEAAIVAQTSASLADLQALRIALDITPANVASSDGVLRLEKALAMLRRLGVSANRAISWANPDAVLPVVGGDLGALAVARDIQRAARAKYSAEAWPSVARPLRDAVRERHRSALVAYLVAKRDHDGPAQLYEDLLIDVEMSPCMLTSRTVQAVAAVQLFVQRALLRLEGDFTLDEAAAREWEWMKSYRVWEANRKVFLYPENWLEPELRDDKTPLFRDFENRLSQGPLTAESASRALSSYLEGLHEIAHLDVVAIAEEKEDSPDEGISAHVSPPRRILHIFARTSAPHVHYYRTHREGAFSPWEKIDLDLPDGHLVPVVHNRRLHLFWPEVLERSPGNAGAMHTMMNDNDEVEPGADGKPDYDASAYEPPEVDLQPHPIPVTPAEELPSKRLFLTLAYSEYRSGHWTKKRLNKDAAVEIPLNIPPNEPTPPGFLDRVFFLGRSSASSITVDACLHEVGSATPTTFKRFARFTVDPCAARLAGPEGAATGTSALPPNTEPLLQAFEGDGSLDLVTDVDDDDTWAETLFAETPSRYELVAARANEPTKVRDALFYKDDKRTFFLERRTQKVVELLPMSMLWKVQGINGAIIETEQTTGTHALEDGSYRARVFYHPYACSFLKTLAQHGMDGLLRWASQSSPKLQLRHTDISGHYDPNAEAIETPLPEEEVDFSAGGAYSAYNWELFFHAPLLVATRLDAEQRYQDADRWYRYIFDPADGSDDEAPARYWKVRPFYENKDLGDMLTALTTLAADELNMHLLELAGLANNTPTTAASESLAAQIALWRKDPFSPHAIARLRPIAYQKQVVMRYIDHLLSWGDHLFRMDTRESVAEAAQLYLFASQLLGKKPATTAKTHPPDPKTYADLDAIDAFSNALVDVEAITPPPPVWGVGSDPGAPPPEGLWGTLYFCLPPNERLLRCWAIVEDRLFKIRCCMNIEGVRRELPLFEPPIDPALLVRAKAAGVDIASVLADLNAGAPIYRFSVLHARAVEVAGYVSSLGAGLLSALEKRDAEHLAVLRNTHEIRLAQTMRQVKKRQIDEAKEHLAALERSRAVVDERRRFYAEIPKRIAPENAQFSKIDWATGLEVAAQAASAAAAVAAITPDTRNAQMAAAPVPIIELPGGPVFSRVAHLAIAGFHAGSYVASQEASKLGIEASYQRREADWDLQKRLAERELTQIDKQIAAASIRLAITEDELAAHEQAIEQAREVEAFYRDKLTSEDLYDWLVRQSFTLHFQAYRLAYQMAKRAEKAYQFERGDDDDSFIRFDAWDGARSGLLAGERLLLDLRRLDAAYLERNRREHELTKHISLAGHAPRELLKLRETGQASIHLTETHFDQDHPTHYLRRLKAVSLSVPCVTGPYQGVHAKLTLLAGETRKSPVGNDLAVSRGAIQSIVTSTAQNDGGQFELVFRDDRYLPFEGVGAHVGAAASPQWDLHLSKSTNRFRFDTIADALLHLRYTARDGRINAPPNPYRGACLLSATADFPDAWRAFQDSNAEPLVVPFSAALFCRPEALPVVTMKQVSLYTKLKTGGAPTVTISVTPNVALSNGAPIGNLVCRETASNATLAPQEWQISISVTGGSHADLADLWIAVDYEATAS